MTPSGIHLDILGYLHRSPGEDAEPAGYALPSQSRVEAGLTDPTLLNEREAKSIDDLQRVAGASADSRSRSPVSTALRR